MLAGPILIAGCVPVFSTAENPSPPEHERYRHLADREVEAILQGKAEEVDWQARPVYLIPDPDSRYINPAYPDNAPRPMGRRGRRQADAEVDGKPGRGALGANR